jgi:hypothetical protein
VTDKRVEAAMFAIIDSGHTSSCGYPADVKDAEETAVAALAAADVADTEHVRVPKAVLAEMQRYAEDDLCSFVASMLRELRLEAK